MKKIIALLLCAALCLGMAVGAFASGETTAGESGESVADRIREAIRKALRDAFGIHIWDEMEEPPAEMYAEPVGAASEEASDGEETGVPMEAMDVMEFSGEEYIRLDDLIITLLLGER